ncbi:unnamed protein product [Symbiodinium sp. CCMP2592]|nr:unnamed protein product [Symbiodinium sp. CCMP2592]
MSANCFMNYVYENFAAWLMYSLLMKVLRGTTLARKSQFSWISWWQNFMCKKYVGWTTFRALYEEYLMWFETLSGAHMAGPDTAAASVSTFRKVVKSWRKYIGYRKESQHARCASCAEFTERIKKCQLQSERVAECYIICEADLPKGSASEIGLLLRGLDAAEDILSKRSVPRLPEHLILTDNTCREGRNQNVLQFEGVLVAKKKFKSVSHLYGPVGHTHGPLDQRFSIVTTGLDFVDVIQRTVTPSRGRLLLVEVMWGTWDMKVYVQKLGIQISGLDLPTYDKRQELQWSVVELAKEEYEPSPDDAVLLLKEWVSSSLDVELMPLYRNPLSKKQIDQFRKTAMAVAKPPWDLTRETNAEQKDPYKPDRPKWFFGDATVWEQFAPGPVQEVIIKSNPKPRGQEHADSGNVLDVPGPVPEHRPSMPFDDIASLADQARSQAPPDRRCHLWEKFSPPRVGPMIRQLGGRSIRSIDLKTSWNLADPEIQRQLLQDVISLRPYCLMLSPPCTHLCKMMYSNWGKMEPVSREKSLEQAILYMDIAVWLCELQVQLQAYYVLEHPAQALSWQRRNVSCHGGPQQFLMHQFPNQESRNDFAEWLRAEIEEDTVPHVKNAGDLPVVVPGEEESETPAYVHPCMFSFSKDCSQCGPVELHKARSLMEQFVVDGFVSSSEPIMLKKPVPLRSAAKSDRLTGAKFMCVRNILDLDSGIRAHIIAAVNKHGWKGCPYNDDSLSSKKLLPGHAFKSAKVNKQSSWIKYGKVTAESAGYVFQFTNAVHEDTPLKIRQKASKAILEQRSEHCALAVALRDEVAAQIPNVEDFVNKRWLGRLAKGDVGLEVELGTAVGLKQLLDEFTGSKPSESKSAASFNLDHAQQAVDEKTFALLMQEMEFDMQAFAVYLANSQSHASAVEHQKNMWGKKLLDESRAAADAYLDHHVTAFVWDSNPGGAGHDPGMLGITAYKEVQVALVNYIAPALIKAEHQAAMLKVMQHSLADLQNVAVFLSPLFSYKKNGRYNEEKAVLQRVSMTGAQMDRGFSLIFNDKLDERDDRPLVYPGHLLMSPSTDVQTNGNVLWKKSSLFRRSRTNEASQVSGKDMIMMENVGESVLPGSTSVEMATTVKGAMKWAQIGHDAALKLLQSLLDGLDFPAKMGLDLLDLNPLVGNFLSDSNGVPKTLTVPEPLVKQWYHNQFHGSAFRKVMDSIVEKFGPQPSAKRTKVDLQAVDLDKVTGTEVAKMNLPNFKVAAGMSPPALSFRSDQKIFLMNNNPEGKKATLSRQTPIKPFCEVTFPEGSVLVGFGKGKWAQLKKDEELNKASDLMFTITAMDQKVLHENQLVTVKDALAGKAEPRVQYHKLEDKPGKPGEKIVKQDPAMAQCSLTLHFGALVAEHSVVFKPEKNQLNSTEKVTPVLGALYAEPESWNTSLTSAVWVVVHSINGLGPVRPVIIIPATFELDGMKAVELKKA